MPPPARFPPTTHPRERAIAEIRRMNVIQFISFLIADQSCSPHLGRKKISTTLLADTSWRNQLGAALPSPDLFDFPYLDIFCGRVTDFHAMVPSISSSCCKDLVFPPSFFSFSKHQERLAVSKTSAMTLGQIL